MSANFASAASRNIGPMDEYGCGDYEDADLFDDDLDSVADSLDAAIKSAADPLRTKSGH